MNCPYCNKPMEIGEIPQGETKEDKAIKWKPANPANIRFSKKVILLSNRYEGKRCYAYLCQDCKKIVIDLEKEELI